MIILIALFTILGINPAQADSCRQNCHEYRNGQCIDLRIDRVSRYHQGNGWYQCGTQGRGQVHLQVESSRRRAYNRGSAPRVRGGVALQVGPSYTPPYTDVYGEQYYDPYGYSAYDQGYQLPAQTQARDAQIIQSEAAILSTQMWADGRRAEVQGAQQLQTEAEAQQALLEEQAAEQAREIEMLKRQREKAQKSAAEQRARADSAEEVLTDILEEE